MKFSFFERLKKKHFDLGYNEGLKKGLAEMHHEFELRNTVHDIQLRKDFPVDSLIVTAPNEYDNIIVGKVVDYDRFGKRDFVIMHDYIRNEELVCIQPLYAFNLQFLKTLSDMNPFVRHLFLYKSEKVFHSKDDSVLISWDDVKERLIENGFNNDYPNINLND